MAFATIGGKLGEYFNAIDDVRKLQTTLPIKAEIPQIVVIGYQSVGKSSLLEMISGVRLPQGSGIVTKCPILLKIRRSRTKLIEVEGNKVSEFELAQKLSDAQNTILSSDDYEDGTDPSNKVVDVTITVSIHGPDLCDLSLVDLPGIQYAVGSDMTDSIRNMIRRFIEPESTLILIVSSCGSDPTTTEALLLAKEYDPERRRSIFILTKPDESNIDENSSDLLKLIDGNHPTLDFPCGTFVMKGRDYRQEESDIAEVRISEQEFFENHPVFGKLSRKTKCGHLNVRKKIEKIILEKMKKSLPDIWNELRNTLKNLNNDLQDIKSKRLPENSKEIMKRLLNMLSKVNEEMKYSIAFKLEGDLFFLFQKLESDIVDGLRNETDKETIINTISRFPSLSPNGFPQPRIFNEMFKINYKQIAKFGKQLIEEAGKLLEIESANLLCKVGEVYSLHEILLEVKNNVFQSTHFQLSEAFTRFVHSSEVPYQATFMKFFLPQDGSFDKIPINFGLYVDDVQSHVIADKPFAAALSAEKDKIETENDQLKVCPLVTDIFEEGNEKHANLRKSSDIGADYSCISEELECKNLECETVFKKYRTYLISSALVFLQFVPQLVTFYYINQFPKDLYASLISNLDTLIENVHQNEEIEEAYTKTNNDLQDIKSKRLPENSKEKTKLLQIMLSKINEEMKYSIAFKVKEDFFFLFQKLESDIVDGLRNEIDKETIVNKISKFPSLSHNGFPQPRIFNEMFKIHYKQITKFGKQLIEEAGNLLEIESANLLCKVGKVYSLHEILLDVRNKVFQSTHFQLFETFTRFVDSSEVPYQATFMKFFLQQDGSFDKIPINFGLYVDDVQSHVIADKPFAAALGAEKDKIETENDQLNVCSHDTDIFEEESEKPANLRQSSDIGADYSCISEELECKNLEGEIVYKNYRSYLISSALVFLQVVPQLVTFYYINQFPKDLYTSLILNLDSLIENVHPNEEIEEAYTKTNEEISKIEKTIQACLSLMGSC